MHPCSPRQVNPDPPSDVNLIALLKRLRRTYIGRISSASLDGTDSAILEGSLMPEDGLHRYVESDADPVFADSAYLDAVPEPTPK